MRRYNLLTGATGLLGGYLLRDAALREAPLAVVVRQSPGVAGPRQRIEDIMLRWEKQAGRALPRPVVLAGDLHQPDLGLTPREVEWVAQNCRAITHNAASLVFVAKDPNGEPYLSNVEGTRHVLGLCGRAGVREFHHVSTAYVCGLRHGRVLESELDVGQAPANDYERSKIESEKMVRACPALERLTVYRPGIIIGDSRTGYTSTYHGFYLPLKAAAGLRGFLASGAQIDQQTVLGVFGLRGDERKNLVPVDWVSAVMTHVINNPAHHGKTYHLTPDKPTKIEKMASALRHTFDTRVVTQRGPMGRGVADADGAEAFLRGVREQTSVYRSYWRDDPEFDNACTRRAAPHIPCPPIDQAMLRRTTEFAVRNNFGWPKAPSTPPRIDLAQRLADRIGVAGLAENGERGELGLSVTGPGGGEWRIAFYGGEPAKLAEGLPPDAARAHLNSITLEELLAGSLDVDRALTRGALVLQTGQAEDAEGDLGRLEALVRRLSDQESPPSARGNGPARRASVRGRPAVTH